MPTAWKAYEMQMWQEKAMKEQQCYCDLLGTPMWREFKPPDYNNLKRNIGFALFGPPEKEPDENSKDDTGYTNKKLKDINHIFDIIKRCMKNYTDQQNILVSFLFVLMKTGDDYSRVPVIRIPEHDETVQQNNSIFIDSSGRVYKDWQNYLENNKLPECVLCYPKNGVYSAVSGVVKVEFGISPAGKTRRKFLRGLGIGLAAAGLGATLFVPGPWQPFAAPFKRKSFFDIPGAVAASVLFQVLRKSRGTAKKNGIPTFLHSFIWKYLYSTGRGNTESHNCWLAIAGSLTSIASGGAITATAKAANTQRTMTLATQIAIKSVTVPSYVDNDLGLTNELAKFIVQAVNKEEITSLNIFQFTSAFLFFTNSVISKHDAVSLINSLGKNSPEGGFGNSKFFMNQNSESAPETNICEVTAQLIAGCSPTMPFTLKEILFTVCRWVIRKLTEAAKVICDYLVKLGEFLHKFWELWNKEMDEVTDKIYQAFGVKQWSELAGAEPGHIRELAGTVIAERRSLVNCGTTVMPSQQNQVNADNSVVGGTASCISKGPNSLVDKEAENSASYDDEVINILAKFVDREGCRNAADFARYMTFICKFVKSQFQEEKSRYEKAWKVVKNFNPDVNEEEFKKQYGISGNPYNYFLQEVFKKFKSEEKDGFTLLKLAYDSQNACTSAQEEHGHGSFDVDGVVFYPFYNKLGLASNGMLSKEQYCEMAAELTGQQVDRDSIYIDPCSAIAVVQVNASADIIMVQCLLEGGKISGIASLLHSPQE